MLKAIEVREDGRIFIRDDLYRIGGMKYALIEVSKEEYQKWCAGLLCFWCGKPAKFLGTFSYLEEESYIEHSNRPLCTEHATAQHGIWTIYSYLGPSFDLEKIERL